MLITTPYSISKGPTNQFVECQYFWVNLFMVGFNNTCYKLRNMFPQTFQKILIQYLSLKNKWWRKKHIVELVIFQTNTLPNFRYIFIPKPLYLSYLLIFSLFPYMISVFKIKSFSTFYWLSYLSEHYFTFFGVALLLN